MTSYESLLSAASRASPVNCHCHHLPDAVQLGHDLDYNLGQGYVSWAGLAFGKDEASRAAYLEQVRHKSYFVWLERALQDIYGFDERINPGNWEDISGRIRAANEDPSWHMRLLKEKCRYSSVLLDCYWQPGFDDGHPELFRPSYRIDPFLWSYAPNKKDRDGTAFADLHRGDLRDLGGLCEYMKESILAFKAKGAVALKSAIAYERGIDFSRRGAGEAALALAAGEGAGEAEIDAFQSYMFFTACRLSAETGTPFQIHTGLGGLRHTRALHLIDVIEAHPETSFVLFHGSYPWSDDICALVHNYANVYVDLCWLPIISPTRARVFIKEMVELGRVDRMSWGCDTGTSEESYGALLAARDALASAFGDLVDDQWMSLEEAADYIERVLSRNAKSLYGL